MFFKHALEQRYERYKEKIKHFTIMNDIFMRNVLKEISCTEYILQVIMNRTDLKVIDQTLQKDYKNLQGRSAILDCVAKDAENNHFNVEIQGENDGASPKRARYHCGLLDMNLLNPGDLLTISQKLTSFLSLKMMPLDITCQSTT